MFRDRLTSLAELRAHSRIATPVIVRAKPGFLEEAFQYAQQFELTRALTNKVVGILESLTPEFITLGSLRKVFRRFNMFTAFLPREGIFDLAEHYGVERIYSDEPVWAFSYPTVPPEGVYEMIHRGKRVHFTTTEWTRRLIGAEEANRKGFTGRGVRVSVVDTGAPRYHQSIARCEFRTVIPFQRTDANGHGRATESNSPSSESFPHSITPFHHPP